MPCVAGAANERVEPLQRAAHLDERARIDARTQDSKHALHVALLRLGAGLDPLREARTQRVERQARMQDRCWARRARKERRAWL